MAKNFTSILILGLAFGGAMALSSCGEKTEIAKVAQSPDASKNLTNADAFLAQNKTKAGVQTTKSGLQYQVLASGDANGPKPTFTSIVRVNYEGSLLDGSVFDSSYQRGVAAEFPVGDLIPAWTEALQLMHPGDEWMIWVHPDIGYGKQALPSGCGVSEPCAIPSNSLLVFKMRLESIVGTGNADINTADAIGVNEHEKTASDAEQKGH